MSSPAVAATKRSAMTFRECLERDWTLGWFLVNVLLPIFAPLLALIPFRLVSLPDSTRPFVRWTAPIKDGQLAWVGLAYNAAAAYELVNSAIASTSAFGWALGGLIFLMLGNGAVAALGGVFPESDLPPGCSTLRHYRAMTGSIVLIALSALAFTGVHFFA